MRFDKKKLGLVTLIAYIFFLIILAVLNRDSGTSNTVKSDLFWGYNNPPEYIYKDNILNIALFIPIGVLAGIVFKKHRVLKALLVGLLVSLTIEFSQLTWKRGVFDIDDLFNNSLGAFIGGLLVFAVISIKQIKTKKYINETDYTRSQEWGDHS